MMMNFVIVVAVVALVSAIMLIIGALARNYLKASPNEVIVLSGRKNRLSDGRIVGYRVIRGGAGFKWPIFEKVDRILLNIISIPVIIQNAYTSEGVPVNVKAVANVKIDSQEEILGNAIERFLGMSTEQITHIIHETLEGHLRSILGTMSVETINSNRAAFSERLVGESKQDLQEMGIKVDVLTIQEISDNQGYLDALGKKRTAEVYRDAEIGRAEAERDAIQKSSMARKEAEMQRNQNETSIAEAENSLRVRRAELLALAQAQEARAAQSGPLADAESKQKVIIAEIKIEEEKAKAMIQVEEQNIAREQKRQQAQVVIPAAAQKEAAIINADAARQQAVLTAQGRRDAEIAAAEAESKKLELEGKGEASRIQAEGDATAAKIRAIGLAEGAAIQAKLLAEAEGLAKKAEAYAKFDETAKLLTFVDRLPAVIQELAPVMAAIASPMSNIDKVVLIDSGGGKNGAPLANYVSNVPTVLFDLIQRSQSVGIDISGLLGKLGIEGPQDKPEDKKD